MNENEFHIGVFLLVSKFIDGDSCCGCKINVAGVDCGALRECRFIPPCSSRERRDNKNVIFVEKQQ